MAVTSDKTGNKGPKKAEAVEAGVKATKRPAKAPKDEHIDPSQVLLDALEQIRSSVDELTGGKVLLKMERGNLSYSIAGAKFTKDDPFQLVDKEDEERVLDLGFRVASADEVVAWYQNK